VITIQRGTRPELDKAPAKLGENDHVFVEAFLLEEATFYFAFWPVESMILGASPVCDIG
jgi:hypothetical protein